MNVLPRISSLFILALIVGLSLIDSASVNLSSNWIPFLGHFHPVLLHLPIGLFIGVALLELYGLARPASRAPEIIRILLSATFYSAALSALFGILLSWEGGYESEAMNFHKWGGVATVASVLVLDWLFSRQPDPSLKASPAYLSGLVVAIGVITVTGHQGGSLTHGSGFLTQYNPFSSKPASQEPAENASVYVSHIQPIFEDYCYQCHSSEKIKGELRLDSLEAMIAGGLNGPAIALGDSENSNLIHAIKSPLDEEEHMPPKGKPQPSDEIVQLLSWWIDQGGSETALLEDLEVTPAVAIHFLDVDVLELQSLAEVEPQVEALESRPNLSVNFIAQNDSRLSIRAKNANDDDLRALVPVKANVVELNLGGSDVTNDGLEIVGQMTNLTHLHLNNTTTTDAGVTHLADLYQLEYLNLFGTAVTDESLLVLRRLKGLKNIFLWETNVTEEAIASLRKSLFPAVESEKLRMQIQELTKERDSLEVDIVSAFDVDLNLPSEEEAQDVAEPETTISDVMIDFHKGKDSIAAQAQEGNVDTERLMEMLIGYQAMAGREPPKGSNDDWKQKTTELIDATNSLIQSINPETIERYKNAVSCKACHTDHRDD